jgi:toxin-antitoxin system PIN domain toxin
VSRPALLDVNVLVALFNPDHVHHETAHDWFSTARGGGWATCTVTEQGLLRILANPSYWSEFERTAGLVKRLRQFCGSGNHHFWEQTVSLRDRTLFDLAHLSGHRQITDVYLLGLAHRRGGVLATFDRTIPLNAVIGATRESLAVVAPVEG